MTAKVLLTPKADDMFDKAVVCMKQAQWLTYSGEWKADRWNGQGVCMFADSSSLPGALE